MEIFVLTSSALAIASDVLPRLKDWKDFGGLLVRQHNPGAESLKRD